MRDKPQMKNAGVKMYIEANPSGKFSMFCDKNEKADTTQNSKSPTCNVLLGQSFLRMQIVDMTATIP